MMGSAEQREAVWQDIVTSLRGADTVLLIAHINPDGDALGSALAAGLAMRQVGIPVVVSFDERPFVIPKSLSWLPGVELLVGPDDVPTTPDIAISFDASSIDRLGTLGDVALRAKRFIAVDHHRSYTGFAHTSVLDVESPATAVLALELVDALGAMLTSEIASGIYTGLTTDTGSFKFAGTTAGTHRIAARLHEAGINHDQIARAVFDDQPFAAVQLTGVAAARAQLDQTAVGGLGMVWTWVTKADRVALGLPMDAVESIINIIRTTSEAEVAVVFKEGDDGLWRVSTRSKGAVDVGEVCLRLGGGGHRLAAGFSATGTPAEIQVMINSTIEGLRKATG